MRVSKTIRSAWGGLLEDAVPQVIHTATGGWTIPAEYGAVRVLFKEDGLKEDYELVVGGYASPQIIDREKHLITKEAMVADLPRFLAHPHFRNANIVHSNIQVGEVLPRWTHPESGETWETKVDDIGLFCIVKLRTDKYRPEICEKVEADVRAGKLAAFSISGDAPFESRRHTCHDGTCFWIIDKIIFYEITVCEVGVNQDAKFSILSKSAFCEDGACPVTLPDRLDRSTLRKAHAIHVHKHDTPGSPHREHGKRGGRSPGFAGRRSEADAQAQAMDRLIEQRKAEQRQQKYTQLKEQGVTREQVEERFQDLWSRWEKDSDNQALTDELAEASNLRRLFEEHEERVGKQTGTPQEPTELKPETAQDPRRADIAGPRATGAGSVPRGERERKAGSKRVTKKFAAQLWERWGRPFTFDQFKQGIGVEWEHADVLGGDWDKVASVVIDHLNEDEQYYTKLAEVEKAGFTGGGGGVAGGWHTRTKDPTTAGSGEGGLMVDRHYGDDEQEEKHRDKEGSTEHHRQAGKPGDEKFARTLANVKRHVEEGLDGREALAIVEDQARRQGVDPKQARRDFFGMFGQAKEEKQPHVSPNLISRPTAGPLEQKCQHGILLRGSQTFGPPEIGYGEAEGEEKAVEEKHLTSKPHEHRGGGFTGQVMPHVGQPKVPTQPTLRRPRPMQPGKPLIKGPDVLPNDDPAGLGQEQGREGVLTEQERQWFQHDEGEGWQAAGKVRDDAAGGEESEEYYLNKSCPFCQAQAVIEAALDSRELYGMMSPQFRGILRHSLATLQEGMGGMDYGRGNGWVIVADDHARTGFTEPGIGIPLTTVMAAIGTSAFEYGMVRVVGAAVNAGSALIKMEPLGSEVAAEEFKAILAKLDEMGLPVRDMIAKHKGPGIKPHQHGGAHRETDPDWMTQWEEIYGPKKPGIKRGYRVGWLGDAQRTVTAASDALGGMNRDDLGDDVVVALDAIADDLRHLSDSLGVTEELKGAVKGVEQPSLDVVREVAKETERDVEDADAALEAVDPDIEKERSAERFERDDDEQNVHPDNVAVMTGAPPGVPTDNPNASVVSRAVVNQPRVQKQTEQDADLWGAANRGSGRRALGPTTEELDTLDSGQHPAYDYNRSLREDVPVDKAEIDPLDAPNRGVATEEPNSDAGVDYPLGPHAPRETAEGENKDTGARDDRYVGEPDRVRNSPALDHPMRVEGAGMPKPGGEFEDQGPPGKVERPQPIREREYDSRGAVRDEKHNVPILKMGNHDAEALFKLHASMWTRYVTDRALTLAVIRLGDDGQVEIIDVAGR